MKPLLGTSFSILISGALGMAVASGSAAYADDEARPALMAPSFPSEPDKKPAEPVNPKTYVEGPREAPTDTSYVEIPRVRHGTDEWGSNLQLGWFYASQTQDYSFSPGESAHVVGSTGLNLGVRYDLHFPSIPLSLVLRGSFTTGTVEARPSDPGLSVTRYTATLGEGFGGLRVHLLPRDSDFDLRVGADIGWMANTYAILDGNGLDDEIRDQILLLPCLELRINPGNWTMGLGLRYGDLLSVSGGATQTTEYRRMEGMLELSRYLSQGVALGIGAEYLNERASWIESSDSVSNSFSITQDLRLSVFVHWDY
jgi:hypothetical protein